jgi:uridylate kinase
MAPGCGVHMPQLKYKRVLVKVSGEALAGGSDTGGKKFGIDIDFVRTLCGVIKKCVSAGAEIGIVVGGGNFWRGVKDGGGKIERTRADHMGMLATTINALALADVLEKMDVEVRVQTAVEMRAFAEPYVRLKACRHLEKGRVVIFAAGTGNPYFSTDTAAVLRAAEINAEVIMLAKNVDGIYDDDPNVNPNAKRYDTLSYAEILRQNLQAMDSTATSLSMDNKIPVLFFALNDPENIYRAITGEKVGTIVL